MRDDTGFEWIRFHRLQFSSRTPVQLERAARHLRRSWARLREARESLQRAKRNWYEAAPRPIQPNRPFCFVIRRMKRSWRDADRARDRTGFPAHRTVGTTEVRRTWSTVLLDVVDRNRVIRIRHALRDEPALLVAESRFRELERAAAGHLALDQPETQDPRLRNAFLTRILDCD